ncbi:MAG: PepSY domain-containing protein [Methanobacteriaceae archaeon]|nr:PepSY domain-containing protein [Methanobacteriaceae archaeon]
MDLRDLRNYILDFWNDGWEKKALIVLGVVVLIILVYAFNPFQPKTNLTGDNGAITPQPSNIPTNTPSPPTNVSTNTSNSSGNMSFVISEEQAKKIALQGNSGYKAGDPLQGTVVVNQTTVVVWIVPLSKNSQTKTVYVDVNSGKVINI